MNYGNAKELLNVCLRHELNLPNDISIGDELTKHKRSSSVLVYSD